MPADLLITRAELDGALVDITIRADRIADIAPSGAGRTAPKPNARQVIDAGGGAVLPGLHDHHLHLSALAARAHTVDVEPASTPAAARAALRAADRSLLPGAWLRASGWSDPAGEILDRAGLDAIVASRPVRVQHRGGQLWVLNSAALREVGLEPGVGGFAAPAAGIETDGAGRPTGRLFGLDSWLRDRIAPLDLDWPATGRTLACYGITGVSDLTPTPQSADLAMLHAAAAGGDLPQSVMVSGSLAAADGLLSETGAAPGPRFTVGPVKVVVADHDLPGLADLTGTIAAAHTHGRTAAVHCVTRAALLLTLAAFAAAGVRPGDRIEHAAVAPPEAVAAIVRLGLVVVTQPGFVYTRGDRYRAEVEPADQEDLWPVRRFLAAGVPVAMGSDAPFGPLDPWLAIRTAADRLSSGGEPVNAAERISAGKALAAYLGSASRPGGPVRVVRAGAPADLCVLRVPRTVALAAPDASLVAATIIGGTPVYTASA